MRSNVKNKKEIWSKIEEGLQKVISVGEGKSGAYTMQEYMEVYKYAALLPFSRFDPKHFSRLVHDTCTSAGHANQQRYGGPSSRKGPGSAGGAQFGGGDIYANFQKFVHKHLKTIHEVGAASLSILFF